MPANCRYGARTKGSFCPKGSALKSLLFLGHKESKSYSLQMLSGHFHEKNHLLLANLQCPRETNRPFPPLPAHRLDWPRPSSLPSGSRRCLWHSSVHLFTSSSLESKYCVSVPCGFAQCQSKATPMLELRGGLLRGRCAEAQKIDQLLVNRRGAIPSQGAPGAVAAQTASPPPSSSVMGLAFLIYNACNQIILDSLFRLWNN